MNANNSTDEIFQLYPNRDCEYIEKDGLVTVLYKKQKQGWLDKHVFKKWANKPRKIDLDEIGSLVWKKCDGTMNVEQIAEDLKREMGEEFEKPRERVKLFVEQLYKNKFIMLYKKVEEN